jgi:CRISPR-associated protein Csb2
VSAAFRVTARFLQPYSHGRGEDGDPEWPPAPLRLFQALVASAVGRQPNSERRARASQTLQWLERHSSPEIVAPPVVGAVPYRLFVPDNIGDKVAKAWSAGRNASLADYRTEKDARPLRLIGEAVHYVFKEADELGSHLLTLQMMARSITHLGWGVDMVVGDASPATDALEGERWIPGRHGGPTLRRPITGTFHALEERHDHFLGRLQGGAFHPVPPLGVFSTTRYARATDPEPKPFAAFRLMDPWTGKRLSLDTSKRARDVAAWIRHVVGAVCEHWPFGSTRTLVHGHVGGDANAETPCRRMWFIPMPTINHVLSRVEGIGRVMVAAPSGCEREIEWLHARLGGQDLVWQGRPVAFLDPLPPTDWVVRQYVEPSTVWSTVSPVVLPGHDDHRDCKTERLLRRAFLHAGLEREIVESIRELSWRKAGFRAGTDFATRYFAPDKVRGPMFHVRVGFATPFTGPLAIGSGRYRGMGVFARE